MTSAPSISFKVESLTFAYQTGRKVLSDVSLEFERGRFYSVIGPNGAGKSTLLGLLSGRHHPAQGAILLDGKPLSKWGRREFARKVAVVPQREESVFDFTAEDMVMMGRFARQKGLLALEDYEDRQIVRRCLEEADLADLARRPVTSLSGGERQRAVVARALAQEPEILLLDEPTNALDPKHQKMLMDLFARMNHEQGITIILVSHDLSLVASYSERAIVLNEGLVAREGAVSEIFRSDFLSEVYGARIGVERLSDQTTLVGVIR